MKKKFFVSLLAVLVLLTMSASSFAFAEDSYTPGTEYTVSQDELDNLPAPPEGYTWSTTKVSEETLESEPSCNKDLHVCSDEKGGCIEWVLVDSDENLHVHSYEPDGCMGLELKGDCLKDHTDECYEWIDCEKAADKDHVHVLPKKVYRNTVIGPVYDHWDTGCYGDGFEYFSFDGGIQYAYSNTPTCGKDPSHVCSKACQDRGDLICSIHEHKDDEHTADCYKQKECTDPHTAHSKELGCYEQKTCDAPHKQHDESCYKVVPAMYKVKLVLAGEPTVSDGSLIQHTSVMTVKDCAGNPKAGITVTVTATNRADILNGLRPTTKTFTAVTGENGKATFHISSRYDNYNVSVDGKDYPYTADWFREFMTVNQNHKLDHKYETTTVEATCTEAGSTTKTCSVCGDTSTEEIEALGHDLKDVEAKAPTCIEPGFEAGKICSRCDYTEGCAPIAETGHKWDNGKVTKAPTYTEEGVKTFTCLNDETHTKTEPIAKLVYVAPNTPANPPVVDTTDDGNGDQNNDEPVDIIDVDAPAADTPDEVIDGVDGEDEEGVYTDAPVVIAPAPEEEMDIMAGTEGEEEEGFYSDAPEEDVPASDVPKTGDAQSMAMWMILALAAVLGLGKTAYARRK